MAGKCIGSLTSPLGKLRPLAVMRSLRRSAR